MIEYEQLERNIILYFWNAVTENKKYNPNDEYDGNIGWFCYCLYTNKYTNVWSIF